MAIRIDLRNYKSNGDFVPKGTYLVRVDDVEQSMSNGENKKPRLEVRYEVIAGPHKGMIIRDDIYLTEKALWRAAALLKVLGIQTPKKELAIQESQMVGKRLVLTTTVETYQERERTRVGDFFRLEDKADFVRGLGVSLPGDVKEEEPAEEVWSPEAETPSVPDAPTEEPDSDEEEIDLDDLESLRM